MKIAFFTETYKPTINGVVQSILVLKKGLMKKGHKVYIFTYGKDINEKDVFYCPKLNVNQGYGPIIPFFKKQEILKNVDVSHTHQPSILGLYALRKARKYGKPIVFTKHTKYEEYLHYVPLFKSKFKIFILSYVGWFMNQCDKVIIPSISLKKDLISDFKTKRDKIVVIPSGIDVPKGISKEAMIKLKKNLKIEKTVRFTLIFLEFIWEMGILLKV